MTRRFDLGFAQSHDIDGIAHGIEDLDFISRLLTRMTRVVLHDSGMVSTTKALRWQVFDKNDMAEEWIFHYRSG